MNFIKLECEFMIGNKIKHHYYSKNISHIMSFDCIIKLL